MYAGINALLRLPVTRAAAFMTLVCLACAQLWISFFEQGVYTAPSQQSIL